MDRDLYNELVSQASITNGLTSNTQNVDSTFTDYQCFYQVKEKKRKILEIELYSMKENKVAIPMDKLLTAIHSCHRVERKCLSIMDTIKNLTTKFEIKEKKESPVLSLVNSAVKNCPFCCKKHFKKEKPILLRWSNGLLYKGYVLSQQGRLCYVELDNFNTAVLDCKDVLDEFEHEVMCSLCTSGSSEPPNEIVLCDCCNAGYHQKCHKPVITQEILSLDDPWFCARCERSKSQSKVGDTEDIADAPGYTLSTLACMALLCMGPSTRSAVHSWVEDMFGFYRKQKSDKWKTKLATTMSSSGHWMFLNKKTGMWELQSHNTPAIIRHLNEVANSSTDIPPHVMEKIGSELKPTLHSHNLYYDFLTYDTSKLTWDAKHRKNREGLYCYCMGPGVWYKQMLQCINCKQWFHQACVSCVPKPMLCGEDNIFVCSVCNLGEEHFSLRTLSDRDVLHLAMYHVVMTRYHGDILLPVCLRMNILPLLQVWDEARYRDLQVWTLAQTASSHPGLFAPGAKHKNTTLYRLLIDEPPSYPEDSTPTLPLPASPQPVPHYLPPGFVLDLSNGTSGLQVDGSPPAEDFPPSLYDVSLFKDVDYYGKKNKGGSSQSDKKAKSGKKRKISESSPQKSTISKKTAASVQKAKKAARTTSPGEDKAADKERMDPGPVAKSLTMKRLQSGENYQILGKRAGAGGELEYLIAWEGVRSRCLQRIRA